MQKQKFEIKKASGFTLIELLIVVAIIALLSSVALIALISARQKSRDVKRLSDMTQMNTALELYYAAYQGYPEDAGNGEPAGITPTYSTFVPVNPVPVDGSCGTSLYPNSQNGNRYYYIPTGTVDIVDGQNVWSDYNYYFCLGAKTGNYDEGIHIMTPHGVR